MTHPGRVESYRIPHGNRGARATVRAMRRLVREALASPLLVETAALIVAGSDGPATMAQRIRDFLSEHVSFIPDPLGFELLRSPGYMLRTIQAEGLARGDCDDVATLAAALCLAVGLPARFHLVSFDPGPFSHIYADAWTGAGWLEMDTTAPAQFPPGLRVHAHETHEA